MRSGVWLARSDDAAVLVDKARELGRDLIVIGRHGQRGLALLILGSVAEQVARLSDASVLLVRKH